MHEGPGLVVVRGVPVRLHARVFSDTLRPGRLFARWLRRIWPTRSASTVATEKRFGSASSNPWRQTLGAYEHRTLVGVVVVSGCWLRLLAVAPSKRRRGIGQALLEAGETVARAAGETSLRTFDQPGNYLAPGIHATNATSLAWFEKRGYIRVTHNTNLIVDVAANERMTPAAFEERRRRVGGAYHISAASRHDLPSLCPTIASAFTLGWAFAGHDGNNCGLGWFGRPARFRRIEIAGWAPSCSPPACSTSRAPDTRTRPSPGLVRASSTKKTTGVIGETRFVVLEKALT